MLLMVFKFLSFIFGEKRYKWFSIVSMSMDHGGVEVNLRSISLLPFQTRLHVFKL